MTRSSGNKKVDTWQAQNQRISRERKELISQYATAAVSLYGVISAGGVCSGFNHYEEAHTTVEEAMLALVHLARTDDVGILSFRRHISRPEFQPESDDYEDSVEDIRRSQRGKPHYLPSKEEFLKYLDFGYREPEEPYAELKAYILKHKLNSRKEGLSGVDGNMLDLHAIIQSGSTFKHERDYFQNARYRFKDLREVQEFLNLVTNVHNHTRMFRNNGFTPYEIFEIQNRTR